MRALILTLLVASETFAAGQSIALRIDSNSQNGRMDLTDPTRLYQISRTTEALSYRMENGNGLNTQAGFRISQPDYSNVLIRNAEGKESSLSERYSNSTEFSADVRLEYLTGEYSFSLSGSSSLSQTPYPFHTVQLEAERGFYSKSTLIGTTLTYANLEQPLSYYTDPDFKFSKRPTDVNAYRVAIHHEQILNENWKMRNEIATGRRIEDRPLHVSFSHRQGYAITDRLFADLRASYVSELRTMPLQNESGYLSTYGAQVGLNFEPLYDLILSVSYGLYFERENDPRQSRRIQVASDQYGVGIERKGKNVDGWVQAAYAATNSGTRDLKLSGGMTWRL